MDFSANPQLMEIATTPAVCRATSSAFNWFCNSLAWEFEGAASTTRMFAPGR